MSTIKISQLANLPSIAANTSNTLFLGVDLPSSITGKFTATTLAQQLYANNVLNVGNNTVSLPNTIAQFSLPGESYIQTNLVNLNGGGTADHVITANNGTDSTLFADFGFANKYYQPGLEFNDIGNAVYPLDGYLYVQRDNTSGAPGGNLAIGTTSSNTNIRFFAGGGSSANVVMTMNSSTVVINGNLITTGNNISTGNRINNGNTTFNGNTIVNGPINLNGVTTFTGDSVHTGNLIINGTTLLNGPATVNGVMTIGGTLVPANTSISLGTPTQPFSNIYTSNSNIVFQNSTANISGNLIVIGNSFFTGNITSNGAFTANGTTTFNGNTIVNGALINNGPTYNNGTQYQTGQLFISGNTQMMGTLTMNAANFSVNSSAILITAATGNAYQPATNTDYMMQITGRDGSPTRWVMDSYGTGSYAAIIGRSARGTAANPTQTMAGDSIIRIAGTGWSNGVSGFLGSGSVRLDSQALENFTDTQRGTQWVMMSTPIGSNVQQTVATFNNANTTILSSNVILSNIMIMGSNITSSLTGTDINIGQLSATANINFNRTTIHNKDAAFAANLIYQTTNNDAGSVTQLTNKSTAVTSNGRSGRIVTSSAILNHAQSVSFTVNNNYIKNASDVVIVNIGSGATLGSYILTVDNVSASGSFDINIYASSGANLGEALTINYAIIRVGN